MFLLFLEKKIALAVNKPLNNVQKISFEKNVENDMLDIE